MNKFFVFVDESGNSSLNVELSGTSKLFILTAIVIKDNEIVTAKEMAEKIQKNFFGNGEMKSKNIGQDHSRRKRILSELIKIPFRCIVYVIDKSKILKESGLAYKESFYKYLNNLVHNDLRRSFDDIEIVSDALGTSEFMNSFQKYVENNSPKKSLFDDFIFRFEDSKKNPLVQVADFLCGTFSYVYDESKRNEYSHKFQKMLSKNIISVEFWPENLELLLEVNSSRQNNDSKLNQIITKVSKKGMDEFLEKNSRTNDQQVLDQLNTLKLLKTSSLYSKNYVSTKEILENLYYFSKEKHKPRYIRTCIIAKLRDAGVIIASSKKGYKIPMTIEDIEDYANKITSIVCPMIDRLKKCRKTILISTLGEYDILSSSKFELMRKYVDKRSKANI